MENLLEVNNLSVVFRNQNKKFELIEGLNFTLYKGETLGIVGESGSGKSVTSLAIMDLLPRHSAEVSGEILLEGTNLLKLSEKNMQEVRGNKIAMIFQEPMTSLNPVQSCGKQIMEPLFLHTKTTKQEAKEKAIQLLTLCGIPAPEQRFHEYPHQLSGGMRQRIMIAIALACRPKLLIADEPTTALDVTIQAQILDLMKKLKDKSDMSIMLITHDLGIVAESCDRVVIMYAGQIMESAPVEDIFKHPLHPYTEGLMKAIPRINQKVDKLEAIDGMVPDAGEMPQGCRFHPRCQKACERCKNEMPPLMRIGEQKSVRCFLYDEKSKEEIKKNE